MRKKQYFKELTISGIHRKGDNNPEIRKIQEWYNLWAMLNIQPLISVDGDYGTVTENAIKVFQTYSSLKVDGIVGSHTFGKLTVPMLKAFEKTMVGNHTYIIHYAQQHLRSHPMELNNSNEGPWVRAYMDGHEGTPFAWCMGFAQTVLDQAFSYAEKSRDIFEIIPMTYSCDVLGEWALKETQLIRNKVLDASMISPGDLFLKVKTEHDWVHTGIVIEVEGNTIRTIEGNSNDEGSREGYEVCTLSRDIKKQNIDIVKITNL
jgi:hypothetical protein